MDKGIAKMLVEATSDFYSKEHASFSDTRQHGWAGWDRCIDELDLASKQDAKIFDLACGNLRFERYLQDAFPNASFEFHCADSCDELVSDGCLAVASYQSIDFISALIDAQDLSDLLDAPKCDACVAFGIFHHIPTKALRIEMLDVLADRLVRGGKMAISFWNFDSTDELRAKAQRSTAEALNSLGIEPGSLDEGDWILGWKHSESTYRYCHSFSAGELDELQKSLEGKCSLVSRFKADGEKRFNEYLVFERL